MALAGLVRFLPPTLRDAVSAEALAAAESIDDNGLPGVLAALTTYFPPARLDDVVRFAAARLSALERQDTDAALKLADEAAQYLELVPLRAARAARYRTAMAALGRIPDLNRDDALGPVISLLPIKMLPEVATLTTSIELLGRVAVR